MSRYYILTRPSVSTSARALAELLSGRLNEIVRVRFGKFETGIPKLPPLIRWGYSDHENAWNSDTPFNSAEKIKIAANKRLFSSAVHGLDIPVIRFNIGVPERFPVVVRQTLTGRGGEGIIVATSYDQWLPQKQYHWSNWHIFDYELGVHIFKGEILRVFKKVWIGEGQEPTYPIRNLEKGYKYRRVEDFASAFPKLIPFCKNFFDQFKISFGRMDIGWDAEAKTYRIVEFNSAPGIATNESTLNAYFESFMKHIFNK